MTAYITSVNGTLVAEVDGVKYWETVDIAAKWGYGMSIDLEEAFSDGWGLADTLEMIYEFYMSL